MLYVSFGEILCIKSVEGFEEVDGVDNAAAWRYATFSFFGGVLIVWGLDFVVHLLADLDYMHGTPLGGFGEAENGKDVKVVMPPTAEKPEGMGTTTEQEVAENALVPIAERQHVQASQLKRMGLLTALAIGIHNIPEGLATFVGYVANPTAGVVLAIAIAMHNVPEGVCVAMPVYYATGSRWQSVLWALIAGISEPIGGLIGYGVLRAGQLSDVAFGIVFGMVAGMMVYISLKELIPTARKFDPKDRVTTISVFIGMAVMSTSLLLLGTVE